MYQLLFQLRAWYQLDVVLTLQQYVMAFVYLLNGEHLTRAGEWVLAILGVITNFIWVVAAGYAVYEQWESFWWRFAPVGMLYPAFLVFLFVYLLVYESVRATATARAAVDSPPWVARRRRAVERSTTRH